MLTAAMGVEFATIFVPNRKEMGTLPAKNYALGVMVQKRREHLTAILDGVHLDVQTAEVVRLNAELTLLLIERGA